MYKALIVLLQVLSAALNCQILLLDYIHSILSLRSISNGAELNRVA